MMPLLAATTMAPQSFFSSDHTDHNYSSTTNDCLLLLYPYPGLYWRTSKFFSDITDRYYIPLAFWARKQFPNSTFMFIGHTNLVNGFVIIALNEYNPAVAPKTYPEKIDLYIDGKLNFTAYPKPFGGSSPMFYQYGFPFLVHGFHHFSFEPKNFSYNINIDVQVGWNGFFTHILPYLLKPRKWS